MNQKPEFTIEEIFGDSLNLQLEEEFKLESEVNVEAKSKLIKVREDGIVILSEELMDLIKKKNLSPSLVSSFNQCPADWLLEAFIMPKMKVAEPIHFARGNAFHSTMELFFSLPKEKRNSTTLAQAAGKVFKEKYPHLLQDKETIEWMKVAMNGYLTSGFDYSNVEIATIEQDGKEKNGIEIFVKGKIGETKRDFLGFVDRVDRLPNGALGIVDYKTGKKIAPFDPSLPVNNETNDFAYWRQQLAYTMILEQQGHYVAGAKLEFPVAKGEVIVDVRNEHLRKQVQLDIEQVDRELDECIEKKFFPFKGHKYCKWCGTLSPNFKAPIYGGLGLSWEQINEYLELL